MCTTLGVLRSKDKPSSLPSKAELQSYSSFTGEGSVQKLALSKLGSYCKQKTLLRSNV